MHPILAHYQSGRAAQRHMKYKREARKGKEVGNMQRLWIFLFAFPFERDFARWWGGGSVRDEVGERCEMAVKWAKELRK